MPSKGYATFNIPWTEIKTIKWAQVNFSKYLIGRYGKYFVQNVVKRLCLSQKFISTWIVTPVNKGVYYADI